MFADLTGLQILFFVVSLLISLSIHEAMHGFVAHWLGDDTAHREGRLTLNPLAHIDLVTTILLPLALILVHLPPILAAKPVPFNPDRLKFDEFGAALVALSGPLTNLVLAGLAAVAFHVWGPTMNQTTLDAVLIFTQLNVGLFVFNMIPFPPLDGSRLLYAVAPEPLQRVMEQIEAYGFMAILLFIFFLYQFASGPIINIQNSILRFLLV